MITQLTGLLIDKNFPFIVLDVNGLGYEVAVPMTTFSLLPELNEKCTLHTHLSIKEDNHSLYGFLEKEDKRIFRELLKLSGVGAKMALTILSHLTIVELQQTIATDNINNLVKIPGIGKKTAEKLMFEMKNRFDNLTVDKDFKPIIAKDKHNKQQDAILALISLGYKENQAVDLIKKVYDENASVEKLIKDALKAGLK